MKSKVYKKIGLDVDGVICNFSQGAIDRAHKEGFTDFPKHWTEIQHWDIAPSFYDMAKSLWTDEEFWKNLEPLRDSNLPFTPTCYITSRMIDVDVTREWIKKHGFPEAPVISVKRPEHKIAFITMFGLDLFVDDLYKTVRQLLDAGHNAVLYEAPYQRGHVKECKGLPKISRLEDICIG